MGHETSPSDRTIATLRAEPRQQRRLTGGYNSMVSATCTRCYTNLVLDLDALAPEARTLIAGYADTTAVTNKTAEVTLDRDSVQFTWDCPACTAPSALAISKAFDAAARAHMGIAA